VPVFATAFVSFSALTIELVKNYVGYVYTRVDSCRAASDSADSASRIQGYMTITSETKVEEEDRCLATLVRLFFCYQLTVYEFKSGRIDLVLAVLYYYSSSVILFT